MRRILAVSLLIVSTSAACAQTDKEEAWQWKSFQKKGDTLYQEIVTLTKQKMKILNQDINQNQEQTVYLQWTAGQPGLDFAVVHMQIIGMKMRMDIAGNKVVFDSTTPEDTPDALNALRGMIGPQIKFVFHRHTLNVLAVEGADELAKKLGEGNAQLKPLFDQLLNDITLREMGRQLVLGFPAQPIKIGSRWSSDARVNLGQLGASLTRHDFRLESIKDGKGNVKVNTDMKYEAPAPDAAGALPFKITAATLEGKGKNGLVILDKDKGRVESVELTASLSGKLEIDIGGQANEVTLSQDQTVRMRTLESSPLKK